MAIIVGKDVSRWAQHVPGKLIKKFIFATLQFTATFGVPPSTIAGCTYISMRMHNKCAGTCARSKRSPIQSSRLSRCICAHHFPRSHAHKHAPRQVSICRYAENWSEGVEHSAWRNPCPRWSLTTILTLITWTWPTLFASALRKCAGVLLRVHLERSGFFTFSCFPRVSGRMLLPSSLYYARTCTFNDSSPKKYSCLCEVADDR